MGNTDRFHSSAGDADNLKPKAIAASSDAFVRSATQPLVKKQTRSLDPEALQKQIASIEAQIQLCQGILDRLAPRMRLLKATSEPTAPASPPAKSLGMQKKPAMSPAKPPAGFTPQERALIDSIRLRMRVKSDLARRIAIALVQFSDAERHVGEASAKLSEVRSMEHAMALSQIETIEIGKLQGRVYPLCNLHEVFRDDELMRQMFPPPPAPPARSLGN